jgi:hypothetical protein
MPKTSPTKHLWRVTEKQCLLPTKEKSDVWDVSRTLVEYDCMQELASGLEYLQKDHSQGKIQIVRVKERFSQPTSGGWSDILVNICFLSDDPQVQALPCEIQFVHSRLMLIRQKMGAHMDYSKFRVAHEILELHESTAFAEMAVVLPVPQPASSTASTAANSSRQSSKEKCSSRLSSKEKCSAGDWGSAASPPDSQPPALNCNSHTYSAVLPGAPATSH